MNTTKVFGIGFHKTGTTSLAQILRRLGYRVTGPNGVDDPDIESNLLPLVRRLSQQYDAFQDNPWPLVFKEMDALHPGSKFILTTRHPDRWIESQLKHFGDNVSPMRTLIYGIGSPRGNEELYKSRMIQHNESVKEYFKDRPDDLLVIDLAEEAEWEPICRFLGQPIPAEPLPHANRGSLRRLRRLRRRVKRIAGLD